MVLALSNTHHSVKTTGLRPFSTATATAVAVTVALLFPARCALPCSLRPFMAFDIRPTSFRLASGNHDASASSLAARSVVGALEQQPALMGGHESHPALGHLVLLVFEAVMEVVCVSLPGYIIARQGMFNAEQQKFVANLNVILFTPCLSMRPTLCPETFFPANKAQSLRNSPRN